ncbi:hypothetical protein GEMRC1_000423 [Eukaryota sp. GEM-RC1]
MQSQSGYELLFKVVLIGDLGSGKSSLLSHFTRNESPRNSTIGVDFATKDLEIDGVTIKAQVWDTSIQERYKAVTHACFRGAVGALLVFDLSNRESFEKVPDMLVELRSNSDPDIVITLIGNKCEVESVRTVSEEEAVEFARLNDVSYIETCIVDGTNVDKAFHDLFTVIYRKYSQKYFSMEEILQLKKM